MGAAKISGVCRAGADPELRFTPSGAAVCSLRAVFQDRYQDRNTGEWKDGDALWVTLVAWRQQAENMAESFRKGDDVLVLDGVMKVREFELKDGGKGYAVDVTVREFGPSARWHAAKSSRVERSDNGPATGGDPWGQDQYSQPPQQGYQNQPRQQPPAQQGQRGVWQGSGQPVQAPQGQQGQQQWPAEPPF